MKAAVASIAFAFAVAATAAGAQDAPALLGEWWTPGFGARVRLEACGDAVCGRIVWLWDEAPEGIADNKPLIGRKVVDGMRAQAQGRWSGGRLYNPEDGRDYQGSLELRSPTQLVVAGCVLFICKTQLWRRVDAGRSPPVAAP